jgi:hypothetical protein
MRVDETVKEIINIVNILRSQDMGSLSQDTLSRLALKLASYKASLGEPLAEAHQAVLDAEADYQVVKAQAYQALRDDGKTSTDAGELKHIDSDESLRVLNSAKHAYSRLKQLSSDCHDLIDSIKNRVITLTTERKEADA